MQSGRESFFTYVLHSSRMRSQNIENIRAETECAYMDDVDNVASCFLRTTYDASLLLHNVHNNVKATLNP